MATNVTLLLKFDNIYRYALSIPVDACRIFSVHPLAWLRYLGFTIYGREGYISTTPEGAEVDYFHGIQSGNYYYVPEGESYFGIQGPLFTFDVRVRGVFA
jgi:hypothetical protein